MSAVPPLFGGMWPHPDPAVNAAVEEAFKTATNKLSQLIAEGIKSN